MPNVGPVTRAVESVESAVDALAAECVAGRPLRDDLLSLERVRARLDAEIARRLVEFDRSVEWSVDGARSAAGWLVAKTRAATGHVHHRMHVARQIDAMPIAQKAWRNGRMTTDHAAVMAKVRSAGRADAEFAVFEPALCEVAEAGTPADVANVGRRWRDAVDNALDRDGTKESASAREQQGRALYWSRTNGGAGVINGEFDTEGAEFVDAALNRMYRRLHQENDPRSPAQQRADAFVEICRLWSDSQERGSNRPHVMWLVDESTVKGEAFGACQSASGHQVSPQTMRRTLCDAFVQRVRVGERGVPLDMGRAVRTFTPDQYRALVVPDGGCRFPGCDVGPLHTEAHHVDEWVHHSGPTDLANGMLVCRGRGHHTFLHEGRGRVEGNANGRLDFFARDGTWLGFSEPRVPPKRILTRYGAEVEATRERVRQLIEQAHAPPAGEAA